MTAREGTAGIDPALLRDTVTEEEIRRCFRAPAIDLDATGATTEVERHRAAHERMTAVFRQGMVRVIDLVRSRPGRWLPAGWDPEGLRTGAFLPEPVQPAPDPVPAPGAEPQPVPRVREALPLAGAAIGAFLGVFLLSVPFALFTAIATALVADDVERRAAACGGDEACLAGVLPDDATLLLIGAVGTGLWLLCTGAIGWWIGRRLVHRDRTRAAAVAAGNAESEATEARRLQVIRRNEARAGRHRQEVHEWRRANAECNAAWGTALRRAFGLPAEGDWAGAWAGAAERRAYAAHRVGALELDPGLPRFTREALSPTRDDLIEQLRRGRAAD
ncbi:hypothetical protein [Corynebacterium sphenisci]|uniref:hypothetical protein n=1 Tax=Corynebacterium sphenisci TaxID=191493 RepID=UPI000952086A|nr:hypothetical protein [Corynebacterium sphenisci]